jgi:polar amino acid transport system substrate-binding protein
MTIDAALARELAPTGALRAAINYGNPVLAQRDAATGEPRGVSTAIARELARRTGLPITFATFDAASKSWSALAQGEADVAFLAVDPKRAMEIDFTAPYVIIEGTYMVRNDSPLRTIADVDAPGVRIAVATGSAYDLYLERTIKHAQLVRQPTGEESIEQFLRENLEVAAGVKSPLLRYAAAHPGLHVMDGRFMAIEQAVAVPKGRTATHRYVRAMVEELKASGFIARELAQSGQADAQVAPPG